MGFSLAAAGLAVSAAGAYAQNQQGKKAAKAQEAQANAQREQASLEQRKTDIANMRSLRSNLRQARIQSAVVANMGANAGTSGSSGVIGGQGSIQSQSASNVGFFNQTQELNGDIYETQVDQANAAQAYGKAQGSSAMWGAIGNLGGSMFSAGGGFKTIFDGPTKS